MCYNLHIINTFITSDAVSVHITKTSQSMSVLSLGAARAGASRGRRGRARYTRARAAQAPWRLRLAPPPLPPRPRSPRGTAAASCSSALARCTCWSSAYQGCAAQLGPRASCRRWRGSAGRHCFGSRCTFSMCSGNISGSLRLALVVRGLADLEIKTDIPSNKPFE